jgi:hypothetical protein
VRRQLGQRGKKVGDDRDAPPVIEIREESGLVGSLGGGAGPAVRLSGKADP